MEPGSHLVAAGFFMALSTTEELMVSMLWQHRAGRMPRHDVVRGGHSGPSPHIPDDLLRTSRPLVVEQWRRKSTPTPDNLVSYRDWAHRAEQALRHRRSSRSAAVAVIRLAGRFAARYGADTAPVLTDIATAAAVELGASGVVAARGKCVLVLLRGLAPSGVSAGLERLMTKLGRLTVSVGGRTVRVDPACGWVHASDRPNVDDPHVLLDCAAQATGLAEAQLDLMPRRWTDDRRRQSTSWWTRLTRSVLRRSWVQAALTTAIGIAVPFALLAAVYRCGVDPTTPVYLFVVFSVVGTAFVLWAEGLHALDPAQPPAQPSSPYPPASAIIAAYLPNEAATIVGTLQAFLRQEYPADLQVILAYNTPHPLPIEEELQALADSRPRLTLLRVPSSTSKAQNINAALQVVTGTFVGIFDADHHPAPDAFRRAWHWLSHGADVVQGHCVIRNGAESAVARTVAVEFEAIYSVSHLGRAKLHGFGLFGGSNGFWRTQALHATRMRSSMLTEDIDSSIRALYDGYRVVYDRTLISRELAPETLRALWHQRLRWAQGWFQVSRKHLWAGLRSMHLTTRNKLGLAFLLGWREVYPWLSLQIYPVLAFLVWRAGGPSHMDWMIPTFVLSSIYTISVGAGQTLFAWWTAAPELRRRPWWFLRYLVLSVLYAEWKNVVARVAQLRERAEGRRGAHEGGRCGMSVRDISTERRGTPRLEFFDGYRALAAIVVVVFHAYQNNRDQVTGRWPLEGTVWHNAILALDFAVDLFFVQSAFLLGRPYLQACLTEGSPHSARAFLIGRAARILPLYYLIVLLVWAITNPVLPGDWRDLVLHLTFTQTFSQDKIFYTDGPAWSLAVEMQFALLLALLGFLAQRACARLRSRSARVALLLAGIGVLWVGCQFYRWFAVFQWHTPDTYWPAWFSLPAKLDVFADGLFLALLAVVGVRLRSVVVRWFAGLTGVALLVGVGIVRTWPEIPEVFVHGVNGIACALLQGATILGGSPGPRWARTRVMVAMGGLSYSLYLWHEPVLRVLRSNGLLPPPGSVPALVVTVAFLLAAASVVAWLSYHAIERTGQLIRRPFNERGRKREYYQPLPEIPARKHYAEWPGLEGVSK
jgi:peptidoglycan/LPS O-acetylase OafA/YrhL/cellulose synthase/poly-beta-1,6-N-acetylglucosamine synthase-like glycosyltransferase